MIPIRLQLRNFLPYRTPDPIYFEGIHLACLTGQNGAGKSSLLDAMTWALWGKARAKRDDDLVHLGQGDMYVELDFEQEGVIYRVVRRRKAGKRGHGALDFFVVKRDGSLQTLSEPNMRATQATIETILRLDYETFTSSAFLQQGKADAFTTKTPAERKRILGEILGLERWRVYEERTKEKLKAIDRDLAGIDALLQEIGRELAQEGTYRQQHTQAKARYDAAEAELHAAEKRLHEVGQPDMELKHVLDNKAGIEQRIKNYTQDVSAVEQDIKTRQTNIERYQEITQLAEQIQQGYATLQEARQIDSELGGKLAQIRDLDEAYNGLQRQLEAQRAELQAEKRGHETTMREQQRIMDAVNADQLAELRVQISELEALEAERDQLYEQISDMKEERSRLMTQQEVMKEEGQHLNERIETLENAEGATCPLCGQALDDDHRAEILRDLITERDSKRDIYRDIIIRYNEINDTTTEQEKRRVTLADDIKQLPKLRNQIGALEKQQQDAHEAQRRLQEVEAQLTQVNAALDGDDFGHALREQMQAVTDERQAIGYDSQTHSSAREKLTTYSDYEAQYTQLEIARSALPNEQNALATAQERLKRLHQALDDEQSTLDGLTVQIATLEEQVLEKKKREAEVLEQRNILNAANNKLIEAEQLLNALERQRKRKAEQEAKREETLQEQELYQQLRYAFGKNGVPLMVIETAIPELETEANVLLTRMTDGRMHLRMTTQQEKVTGGVSDTLNIEIADELGTRPYELYSGGEAFRINFAIRVALSKMLARRAGAHLRTLFVDEGFGTQDGDGRNKLVEAITAIQDDFDLILVITHIDELRDSFPVHVVVEKTGQGSMVAVR